jgi:catalase
LSGKYASARKALFLCGRFSRLNCGSDENEAEKMMEAKKMLTFDGGAPVTDNQNSRTAGHGGPVLLEDSHLLEKLAHFDRERIPERVVHAQGLGRSRLFRSAGDVTRWTKARFLSSVGQRTDFFIRLSTVAGEKRSGELC